MKRLTAVVMALALLAVSIGPAMPAEAAPVTITFATTTQNAAAANGNGTAANLGGLGTATIDVSGTFSATVTFQASLNGTSYQNINCFPAGSTTAAQTTTTTGAWVCPNLAGATTIQTPISSYVSGNVTVTVTGIQAPSSLPTLPTGTNTIGAVTQASGPWTVTVATTDPCQASSIAKSSVAVEIASATTTELVAAVSGKKVYVCGVAISLAGTTPTAKFVSGTKVTNPCDTGAADLTGAYATTAGTEVMIAQGATAFSTPASNELCLTSGGTPSIQGVVTYVQQ